jgi:hypothetical protein
MPRKAAPIPDDPEQSKRFIDLAHELGVDESNEAFDMAFKKVVRKSPYAPKPKGARSRPSGKRASS